VGDVHAVRKTPLFEPFVYKTALFLLHATRVAGSTKRFLAGGVSIQALTGSMNTQGTTERLM
jgi:hypothetical protein